MANRFERSITINARAEEVFDYVADLERHCEWATNPLTIKVDGPVEVGTTFRAEAKLMGERTDLGRVTEFERPRRLVFETEGPAGTVKNWFLLREDNGSCVLTKGSENTRLSMFSRLMIPLLAVAAPKMYAKNLRTIKARVEENARLL